MPIPPPAMFGIAPPTDICRNERWMPALLKGAWGIFLKPLITYRNNPKIVRWPRFASIGFHELRSAATGLTHLPTGYEHFTRQVDLRDV
jgi:hypothetical protein